MQGFWRIAAVLAALGPLGTVGAALDTRELPTWISRTDLVFDPVTHETSRRSYRLAQMMGDADVDFSWRPMPGQDRTGADGRITGFGRLSWYSGSDHAAERMPVAEYVGEMKDGLRDGHGVFGDAGGTVYEGEWVAGEPQGEGRLSLPNGDEWHARFSSGHPIGRVRFTSGSGETYDGEVGAGVTAGILPADVPDLTRPAERRQARFVPAQVVAPGVTLNLALDRVRTARDRKRVIGETCPIKVLSYTSETSGSLLRVFPGARALMALWKGNGNLFQPEEQDCAEGSSMSTTGTLSYSGLGLSPAFLVMEVRNTAPGAATVTGAYIDVAASATDTQPAVQLHYEGNVIGCGGSIATGFNLENAGWSSANNARLTLAFQNRAGASTESIRRIIPRLADNYPFDIAADLKAKGVDVALLGQNGGLPCSGQLNGCLAALVRRGVFGRIAGAVRVDKDRFIRAGLRGALRYDWVDIARGRHQRTSPVDLDVELGWFHEEVECGDAGPDDVVRTKALTLRLDQTKYRLPLPFRRIVRPNETGRYAFAIDAPKSSLHRFTVVLLLADGRRIVSRPVELLYYRPRHLTGG